MALARADVVATLWPRGCMLFSSLASFASLRRSARFWMRACHARRNRPPHAPRRNRSSSSPGTSTASGASGVHLVECVFVRVASRALASCIRRTSSSSVRSPAISCDLPQSGVLGSGVHRVASGLHRVLPCRACIKAFHLRCGIAHSYATVAITITTGCSTWCALSPPYHAATCAKGDSGVSPVHAPLQICVCVHAGRPRLA